MYLNDLMERVGTRIVEGGPFMFEDFGPSWVLLWEDELTATFNSESKELIFVECADMESKDDLYMWMNPKFSDYEKKIYDELADVTTHRVDTLDEVIATWQKNQELYEDIPEEAQAEIDDERDFVEAIERGEEPDVDEAKVH